MSTDNQVPNNTTALIEAYGTYPFSSDETYQVGLSYTLDRTFKVSGKVLKLFYSIRKQGLASILAGGITMDSNSPPEVREELERRTRVFYFNKITGSSITMDEARDYELSLLASASSSASTVHGAQSDSPAVMDENRVLTFAELKELIETGNLDKIPNNKIIPETLNHAPPSQSIVPPKKKPWEMETSLLQ